MPELSDEVREERRARARADRTDRLLSGAAGVAAASALLVSVYQAYITRQQQKLSAWPYVTQDNGNPDRTYQRSVRNAGVGPALVRSMRLTVDGRTARRWGDVARFVFGDSLPALLKHDSTGWTTTTFGRGSVLLPGASVDLIRVHGPRVADPLMGVMSNDARVVSTVCYCSLYGDCWVAASNETEPRPVRACGVDEKTEFRD